jgi:hypothetical protein
MYTRGIGTRKTLLLATLMMTLLGAACKKKQNGISIEIPPKNPTSETPTIESDQYGFYIYIPVSFASGNVPEGLEIISLTCDSNAQIGFSYADSQEAASVEFVIRADIDKKTPNLSCSAIEISDETSKRYSASFSETHSISVTGQTVNFSELAISEDGETPPPPADDTETPDDNNNDDSDANVNIEPVLNSNN